MQLQGETYIVTNGDTVVYIKVCSTTTFNKGTPTSNKESLCMLRKVLFHAHGQQAQSSNTFATSVFRIHLMYGLQWFVLNVSHRRLLGDKVQSVEVVWLFPKAICYRFHWRGR